MLAPELVIEGPNWLGALRVYGPADAKGACELINRWRALWAIPGGPAAMGVLVERLDQDQRVARGEFAEQFAAFASKLQRKLVRDTFA